jgi:GTPase SAR1 family protein
MRIGFCGSQGVGKTTTANAWLENIEANDFDRWLMVPSTARMSKDAGFGINREASPDSQLFTMVARIAKEDQLERIASVISDRTPLDSMAYTQYQRDNVWKKDTSFYYEMCWELTKSHMDKYDVIFYFPIGWPPQADGVRDTDPEYQKDIDTRVKSLTEEMEVGVVTMPVNTVQSRVEFVNRWLTSVI